jgi:DNA-binding CsgD family transcriptional regulator
MALFLQKDISIDDAVSRVAAEYALTEREQEAVRGISMGLSSKELAARMKISPNTVKAFLRMIMIKMGVTTRAGIVAKILDHMEGDS